MAPPTQSQCTPGWAEPLLTQYREMVTAAAKQHHSPNGELRVNSGDAILAEETNTPTHTYTQAQRADRFTTGERQRENRW